MRKLKVKRRQNSDCTRNLKELDWKNWWMDTSGGAVYLHVRYIDEGDETWWRVNCKHTENPRLMSIDGELYWLVDE